MTNRLYYTDAYRREFNATVVARGENDTRIHLDETAFYPTSGGQPHDLGTLNGVAIVDVIDEGERIVHVLASALPAGDAVSGKVDWKRRYDLMQQHTGQHLLSAVFEDLFGFKTVSVHFGADSATLDLDGDLVSHQQLLAVEARANAIVAEARPVNVTFEDAQSATGLRKASDRDGTLRIVSIAGVDRSACGGTHVRTTAEIGAVLLRSNEKIRKSTRVEFVCGERAIKRARKDFETLTNIATSLSSSFDDTASVIATQAERLKDSESARKKAGQELAGYRARERYDAATADATGVKRIVIRDAATMDDARAIAQAAFGLPKVVVIAALTTPPSVLVAASEDSGLDAGKLLKETLSAVSGRGGGSPRLAQGSVPDVAALERAVELLVERK
ncbi:MAG TPA: DHHA1 domain-containing protein [Gemmatimonadaceae bacterium]|jgi:alanyl-tRNA synthetase